MADRIRLRRDVAVVDSPRHASVLVAIGRFPVSMIPPLRQLHDEVGHPRAVVLADDAEGDGLESLFPGARVSRLDESAADAAILLHRELLTGRRRTSPPVLPDADPNPWRGVGPYGQGGKGMTGGTPYGRPLAGQFDDRDGLKLDQLQLRVGPFFAPFPAGLTLDAKLQGDVVQEAVVGRNVFRDQSRSPPKGSRATFLRALTEPVLVRDLELARASHYLSWFGAFLESMGLAALGERARRLAARSGTTADEVLGLRRLLERSRGLGWATRGVGYLPATSVSGLGLGPTGRASGVEEDGRIGDPAYDDLGFEPVVESGGDVRARWRQRLREAASSLELARLAGDRTSGGLGTVEAPWGRLSADRSPVTAVLELLPALIEGTDWGDAVATIASLDLDLEEESRP